MSGEHLTAPSQSLLAALGYDPGRRTVNLSATNPALDWARGSLQSAFGDETIVLHDVRPVDPPPNPSGDILALMGKAVVLDGDEEAAYLEIVLIEGVPHTLLLLLGEPNTRYLTKDFPDLPNELTALRLEGSTVAVSHGLSGVVGKRSVGEKEIELSGFDFRDGLQILCDRVVNAKYLHPEPSRNAAEEAGIPSSDLDLWNNVPDRAQVRLDRRSNRLQFESWWDRDSTGSVVNEVGHAVIYDLGNQSSPQTHRWLRRLGTPEAPIIVEADIVKGFKTRYTARLDRGAPLGDTEKALQALIPGTVQLPKAPETLSLVAFTCAPAEGHYLLTVAAGRREDGAEHLIDLGPAELREVRYTVTVDDLPGGGQTRSNAQILVEIEGLVALFGVLFDVKGQFGNYIQGGLVDPAGVHIGKFIAGLLPAGLPFGLDSVTLGSAWLHHPLGVSPGPTRLELSLDGQVELLPAKALVLDEVDLAIQLDGNDKLSSAQIGAVLTLGPLVLRVQATEEEGAWSFHGSLSSDEGISLKALVDHLVHAWGASVPGDVPDVKLKLLALNFQTDTRRLGIQAQVDWVVDDDVPVLSGTNTALLDFTVARDRGKGGHSMAAEARWTLSKPDADNPQYILDAHARLSGEEKSFGFDLNVPDPDKPLKFSDVSRDVGLDKHIPPFAANALDKLLQVSTLSFDYARPGNSLDLAWTRPLGDGLFLSEYHKNGEDKDISVSWNPNTSTSTIGVQDLASLVGFEDVLESIKNLPGCSLIESILTFSQLGFSWSADGADEALSVTAQSSASAFGAAFFYLPRGEQGGGFVAGVAFEDGECSADTLPSGLLDGVPDFLKLVTEVTGNIALTHIIVSTVDKRRFRPPPFAANAMLPSHDAAPGGQASHPFGSAPMLLGQGLSIGARVTFGENKIVRRVIDVHELDGQVTLGEGVLALQVSLPGNFKANAGKGNSLVLTAPTLRIKENLENPEVGPELDLQGGLDLRLFGEKLNVVGWLALTEESLSAHVMFTELSVPIVVPELLGVAVVVTPQHPLAFDLGLEFESAGLDLGLQASFDIYKNDKDTVFGDAAFVLEMIEEVPNPEYVEFSLEQMSIPVILEAIYGIQRALHDVDEGAKEVEKDADKLGGAVGKDAGALAKGVSETAEDIESFVGHVENILSMVSLKDVSFYWADNIVNRPDGQTVMPGVGFHGDLHLFGWDAYAKVDLSTAGIPGFTGCFETEKIDIGGVLKIWGDGEGVREKPKKVKDENRETSDKVDALQKGQSGQVVPSDGQNKDQWLVEPGGPVLNISTRKSPFLHADLHAELFHFLHADIHADVTDEGFDFDFKIGAGNEVTAELECHWWHKEGKLEAHGDLGVHLHGDIGPLISHVEATKIHLDADLDAHMKLLVDDKAFKLTVNGSFEYEGHQMHIPELVIDVRFSTLADFAHRIWQHVEDEAKTIFADIIAPIGEAVEAAAKDGEKVAELGAQEVAAVTRKAADEAKQIGEDAAAVMAKAATEMADDARKLAGKAEDVAKHAAEKALDAAQPYLDDAEKVAEQALQVAEEAAQMAEALIGEGVKAVEAALQYVAQRLAEVARAVRELLDRAQQWVDDALADARHYAEKLAQAAEVAVRAIEHEISRIEDAIEEEAHRLEHGVAHFVQSHFVPSFL